MVAAATALQRQRSADRAAACIESDAAAHADSGQMKSEQQPDGMDIIACGLHGSETRQEKEARLSDRHEFKMRSHEATID